MASPTAPGAASVSLPDGNRRPQDARKVRVSPATRATARTRTKTRLPARSPSGRRSGPAAPPRGAPAAERHAGRAGATTVTVDPDRPPAPEREGVADEGRHHGCRRRRPSGRDPGELVLDRGLLRRPTPSSRRRRTPAGPSSARDGRCHDVPSFDLAYSSDERRRADERPVEDEVARPVAHLPASPGDPAATTKRIAASSTSSASVLHAVLRREQPRAPPTRAPARRRAASLTSC